MIFAILLSPLLDNFLEIINMNTPMKKLTLIFLLLNIDFISGFFILWYSYFVFGVQNYQEILKFVTAPNPQYLPYHQRSVDFINDQAWDVLSHIFLNCFIALYLFICYLHEINIFEKITQINSVVNN